MTKKWVKTNYDVRVDGFLDEKDPSPRIKLSQKFRDLHANNSNLRLDVGCGIGNYIFLMKNQERCVGIDLEYNALQIAKSYCTRSNFVSTSALDFPFKENTFDEVTMWEVIEHVPKGTEKKLISEVRRVLKKGGIFLLSTPNRHPVSIIMDPAYFLRGHRHYNAKKLLSWITQSGFSIKNHTVKGGWNSLIAMNLFYVNKHIFHKSTGSLQNFFDKKANDEFSLDKNGFANIFIVAEKNGQS